MYHSQSYQLRTWVILFQWLEAHVWLNLIMFVASSHDLKFLLWLAALCLPSVAISTDFVDSMYQYLSQGWALRPIGVLTVFCSFCCSCCSYSCGYFNRKIMSFVTVFGTFPCLSIKLSLWKVSLVPAVSMCDDTLYGMAWHGTAWHMTRLGAQNTLRSDVLYCDMYILHIFLSVAYDLHLLLLAVTLSI